MSAHIPANAKTLFEEQGYIIARGLFNQSEVDEYRAYYTELRHHEQCRADTKFRTANAGDPLVQFPRLMQMHRWDQKTLDWLIDTRINAWLSTILGREPFAVQTMFYFKPPQARGQALHQDNYYLRVQPGSCVAAWMAVDRCDEENGCLQVVPGSQNWPILCTVSSDTTQSFTDVTVPIPPGQPVDSVIMDPGDVLFFNGSLVHGSLPNQTQDRFRRALIGHYIEGDSQAVAQWYHPILRMDGSPVTLEASEQGGQCGVWVTERGQPVIEMSGHEMLKKKTE
ncbi:MAG TPA: phytanoyl-CoA dioxygenase family protein [Caldilineaceae bacterium]|nr:phytanoyl-CoA dioxygenase family protein [Caldilineaceae bacterium]